MTAQIFSIFEIAGGHRPPLQGIASPAIHSQYLWLRTVVLQLRNIVRGLCYEGV